MQYYCIHIHESIVKYHLNYSVIKNLKKVLLFLYIKASVLFLPIFFVYFGEKFIQFSFTEKC